VVVVDSSSTDGSAELAREKGARLHVIPAEEFNHGATRNLGAELAGGEVLVFTSQDAYPEHERWLAELVAPLRENGDVAGSYGRQLPHEDATPPERYFLDFLYGPHPREQRAAGEEELSMETTLFSNVNAAMRRTAWERFPFAENIIMSEDQEWARRALLAGHALRYVPGAAVRHSHPYTIGSAFRRFFDSGPPRIARTWRARVPPPGSCGGRRSATPAVSLPGCGARGAVAGSPTRRSTSWPSSRGCSWASGTPRFPGP